MIKDRLNKYYKNKAVKFFFIPLLLIIIWFILTVYYILVLDTAFSVISYKHPNNSFFHISYAKLLKGDKISGEFKAEENNLGIVSIKFQTFIRPPYQDEDILIFRIKEKGKKNWYYQNQYKDGLIYDVPIFPFGFPKIDSSKGKIYQFEIISTKGNNNNSIALSNKNQILFSKYQVPKSLLIHNKKELIIFSAKKFISALTTTDVKFSSFIYLLPLLFYLFWISPVKNRTIDPFIRKINKLILNLEKDLRLNPYIIFLKTIRSIIFYNLHWFLIAVIFIDIFIIQLSNDLVYIVVIFLWMMLLKAYRLDNRASFIIALVLLFIPPLLLLIKEQPTSEKAAIWAYMFFIAGTLQSLLKLED